MALPSFGARAWRGCWQHERVRRSRAVAVGAVTVALVTTLLCAGCTPAGRACDGPGIPVPAVWVDASEWLAAHPGAEVTACYDGRYQTLPADDSGLAQLVNTSGNYKAPRALTIDSAHTATRLHISRRIALNSARFSDPCGGGTTWGRNARLNADGTLTVT